MAANQAPPPSTAKGSVLRNPFIAAAAICAAALASAPASATLGAVEPAPPGSEEPAVVKRNLNSLAGFYLAGRQAGLMNDLMSAAGFYVAALDKDPENPELLDRSVVLNVASGNVAKAAELSGPLLKVDANDQIAILTLGVADFRAGRIDSARQRFASLKTLGGPLQELIGSLLEAWTLAREGEPARAISVLDALEGPAWAETFKTMHAGLIADDAGLFAISEDRLRLAHESEPTDIRILEGYARTLARAGKTDRALALIDIVDERTGTGNEVTIRLREEIAGGDVAPLNAEPRAGLAEALYGIGRGIGTNDAMLAAALLQLALHLTPEADFPAVALGSVYESMSQHEAAIEAYTTVPRAAPLYREARMQEASGTRRRSPSSGNSSRAIRPTCRRRSRSATCTARSRRSRRRQRSTPPQSRSSAKSPPRSGRYTTIAASRTSAPDSGRMRRRTSAAPSSFRPSIPSCSTTSAIPTSTAARTSTRP